MNYIVNSNDLTAVADAIREKGSTSESLSFPDGYINAIEAISTDSGVGVYEVTITLTNPYHPSNFHDCTVWEQDSTDEFPEVFEPLGTITSPTGSATFTVSMPYMQVVYNGTSVSVGTAACTGGVSFVAFGSGSEIYAVAGDGTIVSDGVDYDD